MRVNLGLEINGVDHPMSDQIAGEIQQATKFGNEIENLVLAKGQAPTGDRKTLLMAYWSLAFELQRAILALIEHE